MKKMRHNSYNNDNKRQKKPKLNLMTDVLPTEILIDIFSRLPVNSICCIKCVSKTLLKTVDDPFFAVQHMRRCFLTSYTTVEVPRLVLRTDSPHCRMHPIKYDGNELLTKSKHAIISDFWTRQCLYVHNFIFCNLLGFTRHGVDYKNGNTCFLLDPFKAEILMLPTTSDVLQVSTNTVCRQDSYGMGFDNKTNTYKIVRISYHHKYKKGQLSQLKTEVLVLGTSSWRELPVVPPCYVTGKSASAHGDMHWLVHGDTKDLSSSSISILSFDFKKEKFYWTPHPAALEKKPSLWNFLNVLNFKGSLALVEFSSSEDKYMKIWALKNDYGNKEWVLNYKIDVGQYLPSLPLGNLCLSECGEWEHGIFFNQ
ncbi:hypothetical protein L3X38_013786 [Prunus dulcis]|uniref:F-box domain-containing protein n=1 Tax=Prunus dulcis TaxID=3755 RepID=A0AAD4ZHD0_PRUDU|nr:hypothetical protein L3X38_013786 [Prunus dulcis]